ncbi:Gfo/Idh/MocA family oxidoreductase [Klebsiella pneumoniae subsp. pneumoniae]|nr:Gfo/Idh/MocA family oxidoreductase [Klebsiella pneumoniae subsp. pneumoniae]
MSDINADNARAAVALPGVQAEVCADGHDVINASDVDAILVTSWDPTHEEYTLAAIAAGKPVFCEKTAGDDRGRLPPHRRCRNEGRPSSGAG